MTQVIDRRWVLMILLVAAGAGLGGFGGAVAFNSMMNHHLEEGYEGGYEQGYQTGWNQGYRNGYRDAAGTLGGWLASEGLLGPVLMLLLLVPIFTAAGIGLAVLRPKQKEKKTDA